MTKRQARRSLFTSGNIAFAIVVSASYASGTVATRRGRLLCYSIVTGRDPHSTGLNRRIVIDTPAPRRPDSIDPTDLPDLSSLPLDLHNSSYALPASWAVDRRNRSRGNLRHRNRVRRGFHSHCRQRA